MLYQPLRFVAVGALNTIFGYSVFALFIWLGQDYEISVAIATIVGVVFNFFSMGKLVFGVVDISRIIFFITVYAVIYSLNVAGLKVAVSLSVNIYIANAIILPVLAVFSYLVNKYYVFRYSKC